MRAATKTEQRELSPAGGRPWRHRNGQQSPPAMVTMLVGEGLGRPVTFRDGHVTRTGWDHLDVA